MQFDRELSARHASGETQPKFIIFHKQNRLGDDEDDSDEVTSLFTIRKQAAKLLDTLSYHYPNNVLTASLPSLAALLQAQGQAGAWDREAGMLALGAMAESCLLSKGSSGLEQHLPTLLPQLLQNMLDGLLEVRVISCWTVSR